MLTAVETTNRGWRPILLDHQQGCGGRISAVPNENNKNCIGFSHVGGWTRNAPARRDNFHSAPHIVQVSSLPAPLGPVLFVCPPRRAAASAQESAKSLDSHAPSKRQAQPPADYANRPAAAAAVALLLSPPAPSRPLSWQTAPTSWRQDSFSHFKTSGMVCLSNTSTALAWVLATGSLLAGRQDPRRLARHTSRQSCVPRLAKVSSFHLFALHLSARQLERQHQRKTTFLLLSSSPIGQMNERFLSRARK